MSTQTSLPGATSHIPVWWVDNFASGLIGYVGAGQGGIEFSRRNWSCAPGKWQVSVTGWGFESRPAVMDDFGNLVEVRK